MAFQSTLPRGERRYVAKGHGYFAHDFNPRSREGSDRKQCFDCLNNRYFNPRSREGSDCRVHVKQSRLSISIHAPARGATLPDSPYHQKPVNFNPRSREGSDHIARCSLNRALYFNPRSREGSDFVLFAFHVLAFHISIHAPARGAT